MANPPPYPGAPRWVKVSGTIVCVLALLAVVLVIASGGAGRHGPGRHMTSGDAGVQQTTTGSGL